MNLYQVNIETGHKAYASWSVEVVSAQRALEMAWQYLLDNVAESDERRFRVTAIDQRGLGEFAVGEWQHGES